MAALLLPNISMGFRPVYLTHLNSIAYRDITLPLETSGLFFDGPLGPRFAPGSLAIVTVEANFNPPEKDRYFRVQPKILFQQDGARRELAIVRKLDGPHSSGYAVQLPMDAGFGQAEMVVQHPDDQNSVTLEMVKANFELIHDPRVSWQASALKNGMPVGLANPLQTGKQATLLATGLGRTPEPSVIAVKIGNPGIDVGPVKLRKDSGGFDFVDFETPPTAEANCYSAVKVYVNGGAVDSLFLPVSKDENPCPHPGGFSQEELAALDAGKCIPFGNMYFSSALGYEPPISVSARFGSHTAEGLFDPHSPVHPNTTPVMGCNITKSVFSSAGGRGPGSFILDPYRSPLDCGDLRTINFLGESKLSVKSPSGIVAALKPALESESSQATLPAIEPGIWEITGTESKGVYYFEWHVPVNPLREVSVQPNTVIPQDRKLVVSWNSVGYKPGDIVRLLLNLNSAPSQAIGCFADASAGRVEIATEDLAIISGGKSNQPVVLWIDLTTTPEVRVGETKAGARFRTSIGGYFTETRSVTLQ